ncbi:MAG TPA: glycosyltransferase family 2 protein [Chitinophagaceae bacterium]|nr:glycosyltransferase family 2 protein [Chitinophagaceae bacterium]
MDLSIVIPLLNEEESLPELTEWINKVVERESLNYEIIFIDDGSQDNSWEVIEKLKTKYPERIRGFRFQRNYGKSAALNVGFKATKGRVVVTMDADLQDSPEELPELYRKIVEDDYDIVSGWKKVRHDNKLTKNLPSKFFNGITRKLSKIELNDFNCGLKAYDFKVIKTIEVYGEMHRYIPVLAKQAGFNKIGEQVVTHQARKYGVSKFGMSRFINGYLDLLTILFMGKYGKRPMHFFGLLGTLVFIFSFAVLVYLFIAKLVQPEFSLTNRPSFFIMLTTLLLGAIMFLSGFLAETVVRNAPERNKYLIKDEV